MKAEVFLPDDYRPAEDEPFMNERQLEYFRRKLLALKAELLDESKSTIEGLQDGTRNIPDIADRASEETDRAVGNIRNTARATWVGAGRASTARTSTSAPRARTRAASTSAASTRSA